MNDFSVRRWTGVSGLALVILCLVQFPLWMMGSPTSVYNGAAFGKHLLGIKNVAFTRILLDQGVFITMMTFAAGFRHLIRQARAEYEWAGTLVFGAAVIWIAVTLVADGLEGGAVLDTVRGNADPSAITPRSLPPSIRRRGSSARCSSSKVDCSPGFGIVRDQLQFSPTGSPRHAVAWTLIVYALLYPLVVQVEGHAFPHGPTFGVPCPTTLQTVGLLFAADPPWPRTIAVIPIVWAFIGGSAAALLGVRADLMLWVAGFALTASVLVPVRHSVRA